MADTSRPVARLQLDTRSMGPISCGGCEDESEDALLMSDGSIVCPRCKAPFKAFEQFSDVVTSAQPVSAGKGKKERWIIEYDDRGARGRNSVTYDSRHEAIDAAADWVKDAARRELETFDFSDDPEIVKTLNDIISSVEGRDTVVAIQAWLDYQRESDPEETIKLGPSGDVSDDGTNL